MSDTFSGRLTRTISQLALAFLNATLILIIVALFLASSLVRTVERATENTIAVATQQIAELSPLEAQLAGVKSQLDELRSDITSLRRIDESKVADTADQILLRLDAMDAGISQMNAAFASSIDAVKTEPGILIDRAVQTGIAEAGAWVTTLSSCNAPADAS